MSLKTYTFLKQKTTFPIALLLCLLANCGDPEYRMRPLGWANVSEVEWTKQFDDFEIRTRGMGGLSGQWWVDPDLQIHNNKKAIALESASLFAGEKKFSGEVYRNESIPPSETGYHLPVKWNFNREQTAAKVLGNHCTIVLDLKVNGDSRQITIEYEKLMR